METRKTIQQNDFIPLEIHAHLAQFTNKHDLYNWASTCKAFYQIQAYYHARPELYTELAEPELDYTKTPQVYAIPAAHSLQPQLGNLLAVSRNEFIYSDMHSRMIFFYSRPNANEAFNLSQVITLPKTTKANFAPLFCLKLNNDCLIASHGHGIYFINKTDNGWRLNNEFISEKLVSLLQPEQGYILGLAAMQDQHIFVLIGSEKHHDVFQKSTLYLLKKQENSFEIIDQLALELNHDKSNMLATYQDFLIVRSMNASIADTFLFYFYEIQDSKIIAVQDNLDFKQYTLKIQNLADNFLIREVFIGGCRSIFRDKAFFSPKTSIQTVSTFSLPDTAVSAWLVDAKHIIYQDLENKTWLTSDDKTSEDTEAGLIIDQLDLEYKPNPYSNPYSKGPAVAYCQLENQEIIQLIHTGKFTNTFNLKSIRFQPQKPLKANTQQLITPDEIKALNQEPEQDWENISDITLEASYDEYINNLPTRFINVQSNLIPHSLFNNNSQFEENRMQHGYNEREEALDISSSEEGEELSEYGGDTDGEENNSVELNNNNNNLNDNDDEDDLEELLRFRH